MCISRREVKINLWSVTLKIKNKKCVCHRTYVYCNQQCLFMKMSSSKDVSRTCAICQSTATQCCSSCRSVFYCSRDHQKQHWKIHKTQCKPFKVQDDEIFGKRIVASRDINAGEVIFREDPLIVGPWLKSCVVCLGCHKQFEEENANLCTNCELPICGSECEKLSCHTSECKLMKSKNYNFQKSDSKNINTLITLLRCMMLKDKDPAKYSTLMNLHSHLNDSIKCSQQKSLKCDSINFIKNIIGFQNVEENFMMILAGILDTNLLEIVGTDKNIAVSGLYSIASIIMHSCVPNARCTFQGREFTLVILANVLINKGETIHITRTNTFWDTLSRRSHLQKTINFKCSCPRCTDPTELQTFVSAVLCSKCNDKKSKIISLKPLDSTAEWKCSACSYTIPAKQMVLGNDSLRREIELLGKNDPKKLEKFIGNYKKILHPKNSHVLLVKNILIQIYGNQEGYLLQDLTDDLLSRKIDYSHEILEVLDILEPGMSRIRGLVLYELQSAMVMQAKRGIENESITKAEAQDTMNQAMALLQGAAEILRTESDVATELQQKLTNLAQDLEIE